MKIAVMPEKNKIILEDHDIPEVSDNNVLVRVEVCAICTWEQRVYKGERKVDFPFVGGHEVSGEVVKLGSGLKDANKLKVGDKVVIGALPTCKTCYPCRTGNSQSCVNYNTNLQLDSHPYKGFGGFSEYIIVPEISCFKYSNVTPEEASLIEPLSCVVHSIETANIQLGSNSTC